MDGKQVPLLTVCFRKQVEDQDQCNGSFESPTSASTTTNHQMAVSDYFLWLVNYRGERVSENKALPLRDDVNEFILLVNR